MSDPFRFQGQKAHLTYKTHIDEGECRLLMETFGEIQAWSFVHEVGSEDEDDATPYKHTHVFVWWKTHLDVKNCRQWDMGSPTEPIHPNFQAVKAVKWAKHICLVYHKGNKVGKDGKKFFKAPVYLNQEGVDEWKFNRKMWDAIAAAPDLQEAAEFCGAVPKSISDCKAIRAESKKRDFAQVEEDCTKPWIPCPIEWDRKKKSLVIIGNGELRTPSDFEWK